MRNPAITIIEIAPTATAAIMTMHPYGLIIID